MGYNKHKAKDVSHSRSKHKKDECTVVTMGAFVVLTPAVLWTKLAHLAAHSKYCWIINKE